MIYKNDILYDEYIDWPKWTEKEKTQMSIKFLPN